jgi:LysM repeat protein
MRSASFLVIVALFLGSLRAVVAAEPGIEFTGVLVADGRTKVALTEKASATTEWVEAGATFKGFTVANYNAKEETITVKKDGQEHRLRLVAEKSASTTVPTAAIAPPPPTPAPLPPATTPAAAPDPALANAASGPVAAPTLQPAASPTTGNTPAPSVAAQTASDALTPQSQTVKPGDTFAKISADAGLSLEQLQALNPAVNPNALKAGQTIRTR